MSLPKRSQRWRSPSVAPVVDEPPARVWTPPTPRKPIDTRPVYGPREKPKPKEWPMLARIVRRLRSAEDKGVGDTLARMLDWFGAKDIAAGYVMMTGIEDCGCGDRQAKLNQLYPY